MQNIHPKRQTYILVLFIDLEHILIFSMVKPQTHKYFGLPFTNNKKLTNIVPGLYFSTIYNRKEQVTMRLVGHRTKRTGIGYMVCDTNSTHGLHSLAYRTI